MKRTVIRFCVAATLLLVCTGATAETKILLATTTSTVNSGLLDEIIPVFEQQHPFDVQVIAVGTGKALRMGRDGDVDAVLVHAREAEDQFIADGHGEQRFSVMYNDFVIIGPTNDPAKLATAESITDAMNRIATTKSRFISRGDDSGTHKKELSLWRAAGITPTGEWYREAGQGMGKVIQIADETSAYTMTDRGTWLAYKDKVMLSINFEKDQTLFNPYGIIEVSAAKYPDLNHAGAQALVKWITGAEAQQMIGGYRKHGEQLFVPSAN